MPTYKGKSIEIVSEDSPTYVPLARVKPKGGVVQIVPSKDIVREHEQKLTVHQPSKMVKDEFHPKFQDKRDVQKPK